MAAAGVAAVIQHLAAAAVLARLWIFQAYI
jgi:hypothetical protein